MPYGVFSGTKPLHLQARAPGSPILQNFEMGKLDRVDRGSRGGIQQLEEVSDLPFGACCSRAGGAPAPLHRCCGRCRQHGPCCRAPAAAPRRRILRWGAARGQLPGGQEFWGSSPYTTGGVQRPVYFISKVLREAPSRYPEVQKLLYVVLVVSKKLHRYFQVQRSPLP